MLNNQKILWEKLAKSNSKYYINSDFGKGITEKEFIESGVKDYQKYIVNDSFIKAFDTILEIGCGIGRLLDCMLRDALFNNIIGIDISGEMIQQARRRLADSPNLKLIETDGYNIPLEDNSIDFVFSFLVFQHFKTKEMIESNFREVFRVLNKKGLFKVRVRTDIVTLDSWWGGIACDEKIALDIGFKLVQKETVGNFGLWLWLAK